MKREVELAFVEKTSNTDTTATSEATAVTIVTAPTITLDGVTPIIIQFSMAAWGQDTVSSPISRLVIFDSFNGGAAASIGILWQSRAWLGILSAQPGGSWRSRFIPAAGTHAYSIRSWVSSASTFRTAGGATPAGSTDIPSQLIITAEVWIPVTPGHDFSGVTLS